MCGPSALGDLSDREVSALVTQAKVRAVRSCTSEAVVANTVALGFSMPSPSSMSAPSHASCAIRLLLKSVTGRCGSLAPAHDPQLGGRFLLGCTFNPNGQCPSGLIRAGQITHRECSSGLLK